MNPLSVFEQDATLFHGELRAEPTIDLSRCLLIHGSQYQALFEATKPEFKTLADRYPTWLSFEYPSIEYSHISGFKVYAGDLGELVERLTILKAEVYKIILAVHPMTGATFTPKRD